jgi:hypothetical protein
MMYLVSGAVMLQFLGCQINYEILQTQILGFIAGTLFYLARNV